MRVLLLTATLTKYDQLEVLSRLSIKADVVEASPDRPNIHYKLKKLKGRDVDAACHSMFADVIEDISKNGLDAAPTLIFTKSFAAMIYIYQYFLHTLFQIGKLYFPIGAPHVSANRIICMYHAVTDETIKESVLQRLGKTAKVLIATTAFGMGTNFIFRCVYIVGVPRRSIH